MKDKEESLILTNFLKNSLSSREIDSLLGHDKNKTRGWESWKILKKYGLKKEDKGKLFLFTNSDCKKIISNLKNNKLDSIIKNKIPSIVKKYGDAKIISRDEENLYQVMSGETRNIIKSLFNSLKKSISYCQLKKCSKTDLDTVHLHKERPQIFKESAKKLRKKKGQYFEYPIRRVMQKYLEGHKKKNAICFLCKKHHMELHRLEKGNKKELKNFKRDIGK